MLEYKVRSGQNIYDIAMMIYGGVEGIFDLLVSNEWLTMDTELHYGMVLNYHENFVINQSVINWLEANNILVKNGCYPCNKVEIEDYVKSYISEKHPEIIASMQSMSTDEQSMYWETVYMPRMAIKHQGPLCTIKFQLEKDTHLFIDWGDMSDISTYEGTEEQTVEHCYKGTSTHQITWYGDFSFSMLDLTELNGIYYPLDTIYAYDFSTKLNMSELDKLIIPVEK